MSRCSAAATRRCAPALTAREAGARSSSSSARPRHFRGGNSRHTRNLRCAHAAPTAVLTERYAEDEFSPDLLRVNGGETDETLARLVISRSAGCPAWMERFGVRFQSALRGTLHLGRTNAFFLGGGKALMNSYYAAAERLGIEVLYDAEVVGLDLAAGGSARRRLRVGDGADRPARQRRRHGDGRLRVEPRVADARPGARPPTTSSSAARPTTRARRSRLMLDAGAQPVGDPRACHAVAVDARAPKFDGGIVTRLDCMPLGIVVNRHGDRFCRRGRRLLAEAIRELGHARGAATGPDRVLRSSMRRRSARFMPSVFPPLAADSIRELATLLERAARPSRVDRRRVQQRRAARHASTTQRSTTAAPSGSPPTRRTGRNASIRRRSGAIRCGRASRSPIWV